MARRTRPEVAAIWKMPDAAVPLTSSDSTVTWYTSGQVRLCRMPKPRICRAAPAHENSGAGLDATAKEKDGGERCLEVEAVRHLPAS